MSNLLVLENTAIQTIDSREVAEMVGKQHNELLKDIRRYVCQFNEGNLPHVDFFQESSYQDTKGEARPCYLVTRKGCEFIANKLTGVKGTEFTARYINRFHDMEDAIKKDVFEGLTTEMKGLIIHDKMIQAVDKKADVAITKADAVNNDLQAFKLDMPLLGLECDRITTAVRTKGVRCLGGKDSVAYKDKSLRGKVYADIYRELKRQFGLSSFKAIKRSQCDVAVKIIENYELPFVLADEIADCNAQFEL